MIRGNDPILLTPGPLTTSLRTKQAMLSDWGSWDAAFNSITASIRRDTVDIINGGDEYTCVPLQGSGTLSVEAAIGTLVPRDGKVLVPNKGAYCAHRSYLQVSESRSDRPRSPGRSTDYGRDRRRCACRRFVSNACRAGALRNRRRHVERSDRGGAGMSQARQGLDRRCDEFVWRAAD